jgi:hypothetical protein
MSIDIIPLYITSDFPTPECVMVGDAVFDKKHTLGHCVASIQLPHFEKVTFNLGTMVMECYVPSDLSEIEPCEYERGILTQEMKDDIVSRYFKEGKRTILQVIGEPLLDVTRKRDGPIITETLDAASSAYSLFYGTVLYATDINPEINKHRKLLACLERQRKNILSTNPSLAENYQNQKNQVFEMMLRQLSKVSVSVAEAPK